MRPVTSRFLDAIARSHILATRAAVLDQDGAQVGDALPVTDGTVTLDATAATRGRADLTVIDDGSLGLVPDSATSVLAPYGNEVRVERGVLYPDGTDELVSLGVFRLDDVETTDQGAALEIRIVGLDRSARFIDARFEEPYQLAAGQTGDAAILAVLQAAWPDLAYDFTATTLLTPAAIGEEGGDRWQFAQSIATSVGMELYFDGDGVAVLRPVTRPSDSPVVQLVEGDGGLLLPPTGRRWTRQGAFNRVIATGEATDTDTPPARGVATDDDPLSPTYYFGPFGKVPRFYSSPFIATDQHAIDAAEAILSRELGTTQQVQFGSVVNAALEPGDVAQITRQRAGIDETHVIDQLTIPLAAAGTMTGSTRATQVTA